MNNLISSKLKKRALAVAVASCISVAPMMAEAAGLGRITVLSGLGQPLRAELEINATREEQVGMAARLAPVDAFRQAGIDYSSVLTDLRFAMEKRPDGKQVVKITSGKPVNEPFLDFLVELNWSSGRLVREYTFLLDPPEMAVKSSAARPMSVVEAKTVQALPGGTTPVEPTKPVPQQPAPKVVAPAPVAPAPAKPEAEPKKIADSAETRVTKTGDTLGKIASATKYQEVSLEQMLVGLYQSNPDAFIGKNLNRLKSGAILSIPDKAAVEAIPQAEAKKIFLAQSGDWNAYRQKVASAAAASPVKDEASSQQTTGKITAKLEEKPLPAEQSKDQVKVSRSEMAGKQVAASGLSEEDKIAKDKALKEAGERLALLEKNVNELQKLVDLKNQKLAELEKQTVAKPEPAKPTPPPPAPAKEEVKPVEPPKAVVEESKPQEPVKPVEAVKPPEPTPAPAPKPVAKPVPPPPPPPPEPSLVDSLLEEPTTLAAGGGILALLLGYVFYKRRRTAASPATTAVLATPSSLGENSVFRMTGGQSVDTSNTPPQTGDFSQTGPGTIDTDEVDPVAEADVYMAYGRDAQAEEILLEALQKDPQRTAIHAKLLEIYANRQSLKQFETLASELYAQTAGVGPEWEKVAAMGAKLDPANPLYTGASVVTRAAPAFDADATMVVTPARVETLNNEMSFDLPASKPVSMASEPALENQFAATVVQQAIPQPEPEPVAAPEVVDLSDLDGLDFDLGSSIVNPPVVPEPDKALAVNEDEPLSEDALDFDLGMSAAPEVAAKPQQATQGIDLDVELRTEPPEETPDFTPEGTLVMSNPLSVAGGDMDVMEIGEPAPALAAVNEESLVDFELDLDNAGTATVVNPDILRQEMLETTPMMPPVQSAAEEMVSMDDVDSDALEFDMKLTDSTVLGQPMSPSSFDISSINLDLAADEAAAEQALASAATLETVASEPVASQPAPAGNAAVDAALREEINTKLDLAKAYEEMGDLEGARELLSEVAAEGPPDLATEAKEILARIGS